MQKFTYVKSNFKRIYLTIIVFFISVGISLIEQSYTYIILGSALLILDFIYRIFSRSRKTEVINFILYCEAIEIDLRQLKCIIISKRIAGPNYIIGYYSNRETGPVTLFIDEYKKRLSDIYTDLISLLKGNAANLNNDCEFAYNKEYSKLLYQIKWTLIVYPIFFLIVLFVSVILFIRSSFADGMIFIVPSIGSIIAFIMVLIYIKKKNYFKYRIVSFVRIHNIILYSSFLWYPVYGLIYHYFIK